MAPSEQTDRTPVVRWAALFVAALVAGVLLVVVQPTGDGAASRGDALTPSAPLVSQVAALEETARTDPQDLRSRQRLGAAYVARALETGDPQWYARAEAVLAEAEAVAPSDPETTLTRATLALALHDFDAALALGEETRVAMPANPAVLGVVVDAQVELGRYEAAATTLQEMLDRRPALPALARTSYLRQLNGDLPGAVEAMQRARDAGAGTPFDVAVVDVLLGDLHLLQGDVDAASRAADRALAAAPGSVPGEVLAAEVAAARGDLDAAVSRLEAVSARYPATVVTTLLAQLQRRQGDEEAAARTSSVVAATARLQEAAGQAVDLEAALAEADAGDAAAALAHARSAEAVRPDNVFVADAVAWALHASGDDAGALPYVERALRLGTADPLLHFHAAVVLAAVGEEHRAADALRRTAQSPWFSFGHLAEAGALAERLGVDAPPAWTAATAP